MSFHPRVFILITFIFCSRFAFTQTILQGTWMAGGETGFQSSKPKDGKANTTFTLSPDIGYYIIDDLAVGLAGTYSRTSSNSISLTILSLNPWARYYVYKDIFGRISYQAGNYRLEFDSEEAKTTFNGVEIGAGYSAWLSNSVAIEPVLFYSVFSSKDESENIRENGFGVRVGIQVFLGRD